MDRKSVRAKRRASRLRSMCAAALLATAMTTTDVVAQTAAWQKVWDDTVATAKKEGAVACGCPRHPGSRQFLLTQWSKAFPEIKLEYTAATLPEWPARVEAERQAGQYLWDVFFTGPGPEVFRLARTGVFEPLVPNLILPDVKDPEIWGGWDTAFYDDDKTRLLAFWREISPPYYNARLVVPKKVDTMGLRILLDPQYRGKIVMWDPRVGGSGENQAAFLYIKLGEEALRKLLVDQQPIFLRDSTAMAERLVRGTAVFSLGPQLEEPLEPFRRAGLSFDIRPFGDSKDMAHASAAYGTAAILNRPAHPNAAKVFMNWMLTKDVQEGLSKATTRQSRRRDVPPIDGPAARPKAGEDYVELQREEFLELRQKLMLLATQLRPE